MKKLNLSFLPPFLLLLFAVFAGIVIHKATWFNADSHFSILAQSFLHNDLFLSPNNLPNGDYVDFFGKQYLFFGPMPSILLMPFVIFFGRNFPQIMLSFVSLAIVYASTFVLGKRLKIDSSSSFWLANFFTFGTVMFFVGLVNISAYVVQAVATVFLMLSLVEYFGRRRFFVIGLLVAGAIATRMTLIGAVAFYLLEIFRERNFPNFFRNLRLFFIPIIFCILMLSIYNYKRFHSFFDTGYTKNVSVLDKDYYNNKLGNFGLVHVPTNIYSMIFRGPDPVKRDHVEFSLEFPWLKADGFGMGILYTSPLFIYLLLARKEKYTTSAIIATVFLTLPSLLYWGIGATQYGYRYSLDFLPFLFLILVSAFKKGVGDFGKVLITYGVIFNSFYMLSMWNLYPLLSIFDYIFK